MPVRIEFTGEYAALMGGYVAFRQNLGLAMPEGPQRWLRHMADLLYTMPPVPEAVDMEGAEAIAPGREGEPDAARLGRLVVLRQLCPCPDRIGVGACVPPAGQAGAGGEFVPRIAGEREMARTVEVAEGKALRWPPMAPEIPLARGHRGRRGGGAGRRRLPSQRPLPLRRPREGRSVPHRPRQREPRRRPRRYDPN